jgi:hypothetical protein
LNLRYLEEQELALAQLQVRRLAINVTPVVLVTSQMV